MPDKSDVRVLELIPGFSKALFAPLAHKGHLLALLQGMFLSLAMAFCAIEPLSATWGANGNLGIEDVFTARVASVSRLLAGANEDDTHHIANHAWYLYDALNFVVSRANRSLLHSQ